VVKGVHFTGLRDVGDPVELASATRPKAPTRSCSSTSRPRTRRATLLELARRTAERLFIPLTIGGGIRTVEDDRGALRAGADKVSVNSAAVRVPRCSPNGAERFGAQCMVASIDAKWVEGIRRVSSRPGGGVRRGSMPWRGRASAWPEGQARSC
jgi:imidazole glycerol-phosphate synthase subunit HisF